MADTTVASCRAEGYTATSIAKILATFAMAGTALHRLDAFVRCFEHRSCGGLSIDGHGGHGAHAGHEVNVWEEMFDWLDSDEGDLLTKQGQGLHVVMPPSTSPTLLAAVNRMKSGSFPKAKFHRWSALNQDHALQGAQLAYGKPMVAHYDYGKIGRAHV